MEWSRSDVLTLARLSCLGCGGSGRSYEKAGKIIPCHCVLRAVFRACYARFRFCAIRKKHISRISFERHGGRERRMMWGRKDEEYIADFYLIGKRALGPFYYRIFSIHYLLGADWRLCCRRLGMDKGSFFHAVYRVQEALGRIFYELEPYGLYPPRVYFATRIGGAPIPLPPPPLRVAPARRGSADYALRFRARLDRRRPEPRSLLHLLAARPGPVSAVTASPAG